VLLLFLSLALQLAFQFGVAPFLVDQQTNATDSIISSSLNDNIVQDAWMDGCEKYQNDNNEPHLFRVCVENNGNFRVAAVTTLFFLVAALAAFCKPTANREAWPAKFILFLLLVGITVIIPNEPLFSDIYLNVARIGGVLFIFFQQLVILDLAHNWNDSWVEKSNRAEVEEAGSGKKWLMAIIVACAILFLGSVAVLVYMFVDFTGCASNNAFIAVTLILCILITTAQLSGEEGSLLSSACISAWATFLCYTAVSKNPDESCNPRIGEPTPLSIAFGLTVTAISLLWTGWSYTAEDKLGKKSDTSNNKDETPQPPIEEAKTEESSKPITGVVTGTDYGAAPDGDENNIQSQETNQDENVSTLSNTWKLDIALAVVVCWSAMTLTQWGGIQADGTVANPSAGRTGMWMIIASQWLVMTLYVWTLVAPRLFPDRDFS
jgi:hypothetical protein